MQIKAKAKIFVLIGLGAIIASAAFWAKSQSAGKKLQPNRTVRVAFGVQWKLPLYPASQHSMIEDAILANQFESLVTRGENGLILPQCAKSYRFNDDFTVFDFDIDTSRRFSDGSTLTASDFKRSWEEGLRLRKNSANRNLEDMVTLVVGFEDFDRTGSLRGVEVISSDHLRVTFKRPFRMALMHLTGSRFAAFQHSGEKFLGTGRFVISPVTDSILQLKRNLFHPTDGGLQSIEIVYLEDPEKAIALGDIDIVAMSATRVDETDELKVTVGVEDASLFFHLNGLKGRTFSESRLRLAFQALVHQILKENPDAIKNTRERFQVDEQTFLPLQAGRLPQNQAAALVAEGDQYIDMLIKASQVQPIKIAMGKTFSFLEVALQRKGLKIISRRYTSTEDYFNEFYYKHESDVALGTASVHLSDPDGMYHYLGKHGAITSPMIQRPLVAELFEVGRNITDQDQIVAHYQKAAEAILKEVPAVHLGFVSHSYIYRADRLQVDRHYLERHFDQFAKVFNLK